MPNEISLTQAAHALKMGYHDARNAAITGVLEARQTPTGRWMVSAASVERLRNEADAGQAAGGDR